MLIPMRRKKPSKLEPLSIPEGYRHCSRCSGTGAVLDPVHQGAEMRQRRESAGATLREVARRMELSVAYVSDLELGRRGWNEKLIARYMEALT